MKYFLAGWALPLAVFILPPVMNAQVAAQSPEVAAVPGDDPRDLSGTWLLQDPNASFSAEQPPAMTSWAMETFHANKPTMGPRAALDANDPTLDCLPPGVPYVFVVPTPLEIVQTPGRVIQLFEYNHTVRRIYTDGRRHPMNLQDTGSYEWMGHSIGWWEANTFVIDTIGFNDKTWADRLGHPHSEALHVVERVRRAGNETLEYEITIQDPKAYLKSWTGRLIFKLKPDWDILEHVCTAGDAEYLQYKDRVWTPAR